MSYKRFSKLILLITVLLILFISIPSCITAANQNESDSQGLDLIKTSDTANSYPQSSELIENSNQDSVDTSISQNDNSNIDGEDYYFDINAENEDGDGTKNNPYKTLKDERVLDNSNIHLAKGTYDYKPLKSHSNIAIIGESAENTIINGNGRILTVNNNFILRDVTLFNITIINNGKLKAYNTIFSSSTSQTNGGSIRSNENKEVYLNNCNFIKNNAQHGGAIYMNGGNLEIIDSKFINNTASSYGGAIVCENSKHKTQINIQRTEFINDKSNEGGAIYIRNSVITIDYTNFNSCSAKLGGAITSITSDNQLDNLISNNNSAIYEGGFLYQIYGNLTIKYSKLSNNSAKNGGSIYSVFSKNAVINNNEFNTNSATNFGGALFVDEYPGSINNNIFTNNKANIYGGAIYSIASPNSTVTDNTYIKNTASKYNDLYETLDLINLIKSENYTQYYINIDYDGEIPSKYDLRDYGYVTPVKDQKNGGNCWAFYSIGAVESAILKATGMTLDLSEENMKNLIAKYSIYGWTMETNEGGYEDMPIGYLTSWLGPVYEYEDPYDDSSILSPLLNSLTHIQNIAFLKRDSFTDNNGIKEAILKYGAVSSEIYYTSSYKSSKNGYYYDGDKSTNHGVLIVGWDDNYSKSNFDKTPPGNGAWIVKNSWGTSWGDNGYFYVSYYDTSLARIGTEDPAFVIILNDTTKYDKNYQYDIPGKTDYFLNTTDTVWYKNIFNSTDNEYLAAVSTYFQKDTNWELTININNITKHFQTGFSNAGYYTINLNQMLPLKIGDIFEIIFKISVDKDAGVPISEYISLNKYFYKENISFLSYDGITWTDFYQIIWDYPKHIYNSQVACIKAFTILNPIATKINLDITNRNGNYIDLMATVYNEYNLLVNSGTVTFKIGTEEYTATLSQGFAKLTNILINNPNSNIYAKFSGTGYVTSDISKTIHNPLINTKLDLTISNSKNNPINISAHVLDEENNPINYGFVRFNVRDRNYDIDVIDGFANLTNVIAYIGDNYIFAEYKSDLFYYNNSNNTKYIYIEGIKSKMKLEVNSTENPYKIIAYITDLEDNPINYGFVRFNLSGTTFTSDVINGISSITHIFTTMGINNISAKFIDSKIYEPSSNHTSIEVFKKEVELNLENNINENTNTMKINIPNCLLDYDIIATINGKIYNIHSTNGYATLELNDLDDGEYSYKISLISSIYEANDLIGHFNIDIVKTKLINLDSSICKNGEYSVILKDKYDIPIKNKLIFLNINGKTYRIRTNDYGIAAFTLNLEPNTYYATIEFLGDEKYIKSKITRNILIKNSIITPTNTQYTLNAKYEATILDTQGNPLMNEEIIVTVAEKTYKLRTDNNGKISLNIDLKNGNYLVIINNHLTDETISQLINVVPRIRGNKGLTIYFNSGTKYKVRIYDDNGNVVGAGQIVTFKINKKTYKIKTDKNGYANLKITQKPGTYTVYATYNGYTVSNKIKVKPTLITKNISTKKGKKIKFTAKLLNNKGKILKNKKITFKIKGKTYKAKTNKKGIATIYIKLKLKIGEYKIVSSYEKTKVTNKIKIKK